MAAGSDYRKQAHEAAARVEWANETGIQRAAQGLKDLAVTETGLTVICIFVEDRWIGKPQVMRTGQRHRLFWFTVFRFQLFG
jgi:hypothetical protein